MSPCSYADSRKRAVALLAQINYLPQREWEQKLRELFMSDEIMGPLVVAWMCQQMMKTSSSQNAGFWQSQIDECKNAARTNLKVRRGWEEYGMTPWEVCMHRGYYKNPILPRYHSEPAICCARYADEA